MLYEWKVSGESLKGYKSSLVVAAQTWCLHLIEMVSLMMVGLPSGNLIGEPSYFGAFCTILVVAEAASAVTVLEQPIL
jgi:hypothetical protein